MRLAIDWSKVGVSFERQLLVFPVIVVLLVSFAFFGEGTCALWQWLAATIATCALPWMFKARGKEPWMSTALFLIVWIGLLFVAPMTLDSDNGDNLNYHLPVIRLLCEGWNPVTDSDLSQIMDALGLQRDGFGYHHVAFVARTIAVFSAVSYTFTRDPLAVTFPLVYFLFLGLMLSALRAFGRKGIPCAILFLLLVWRYVDIDRHVDCSAALASAGLLMAMMGSFRRCALDPIPMISYTFWMFCLKIPCACAAVLFWLVFFVVVFRRQWNCRTEILRKGILMAVSVIVLFAVAAFHPYGTSFRDYGHPLYPFKTVDEVKYPAHDITADFKVGNADYKLMSHPMLWINAFVSPKLVQAYYNRKLGRFDFKPHSLPWGDYEDPYVGVDTPVSFMRRLSIWLAFGVLLVIPASRPFAWMLFLSLFVLPKQHIGYLRYMPWLDVFRILPFVMIAYEVVKRWGWARKIMFVGIGALVCCSFLGHLPLKADVIEIRYHESRNHLREAYARWDMPGLNNLRLLMKELGKENVPISLLPDAHAGETGYIKFSDKDYEKLGFRNSKFGYYCKGDANFEIPIRERSGSLKRYIPYVLSLFNNPRYWLRAFALHYPALVFGR